MIALFFAVTGAVLFIGREEFADLISKFMGGSK